MSTEAAVQQKETKSSTVLATGRRKEATARVRLLPGTGQIQVNGRALHEYFPRPTHQILARQPLEATNSQTKYDVWVNVSGGGSTGQAGAVRHAIARALVATDAALRSVLRRGGHLTRDPRMKERKKYGQKGARRRFQWTKR